jgi:hypothetical protein
MTLGTVDVASHRTATWMVPRRPYSMRERVSFEGAWLTVLCLVDDGGVQLTHVGELPSTRAGIDRVYPNVDEVTAQTALREQSETVLQTMFVDSGCTPSVSMSQAEQLGAESMAASGECIPAQLAAGTRHILAGLARA